LIKIRRLATKFSLKNAVKAEIKLISSWSWDTEAQLFLCDKVTWNLWPLVRDGCQKQKR